MAEPKDPVCSNCGHTIFNNMPILECDMTFVCCAKCGTIVAYRDRILIDKLDNLFEALSDLKQTISEIRSRP